MQIQRVTTLRNCWYCRGLALLLWVLTLAFGLVQPAQAQSTTDGYVAAWGNNFYGQSSVPAGLGGVTAIVGGLYHSLALKGDGTVIAWGSQSSVPAGLSGVTAIAAGGLHSLALKSDGTVVAWGDNFYGQSSVPAGLSGVTAIASGGRHNLALKGDGTVVAWGWNFYGQSSVPAGLSGVTAIAVGGAHSLALKSDGTVVAWGDTSDGQSSVPAGLSGVTAIAAGFYHSLALKGDGTVVAWGDNDDGQSSVPAGLSGVTAIAAGASHSLALKGDGTVVAWGDNFYGQSSVPAGLSGVTAIAAGFYHSLAIRNDKMPPSANPSQSPAATAAGWNNTNVTVTWNWSDSVSGLDPANCTLESRSSGEGQIDLTATCRDQAGNEGRANDRVRVDRTRPTVDPRQNPPANANGWSNRDVRVEWQWADPVPGSGLAAGLDPATCPPNTLVSSEGRTDLSLTCFDLAGNEVRGDYRVQLDKTAPGVTVTGVSNGASYTLGSVPVAGCNTTDTRSGVATPATVSVTGGNVDGMGTFTATCSGATDLAGNSATPVNVSYTVNGVVNSSVSQQSVNAVYNATPQACPASGGNLPLHTVTPTLRNSSTTSFTGLFFRVKSLAYTTAQGGQQPILCNVTIGGGGVGSTLTIANSNLPSGNAQFNPGENLLPVFQVGLPVRAQYRFLIDLYAVSVTAATVDGAAQDGEYLGSFDYTFAADETEPATSLNQRLFLPLIAAGAP